MTEAVGEGFIDAAYEERPGASNDDCPVSIVMGATSAARHTMFFHGGFRDRKPTGLKTGSTYFYMNGCEPASGRKL